MKWSIHQISRFFKTENMGKSNNIGNRRLQTANNAALAQDFRFELILKLLDQSEKSGE